MSIDLLRLPGGNGRPPSRPPSGPWGIWMSFAWATLALVIGLMTAEAISIALTRSHLADSLGLYREGHPIGPSLHILAATVTVTILAFAVRPLRWSPATYLGLVRPHGRFVLYALVWTALPLMLTLAHTLQFDLGQLQPHGFDRARTMNGLLAQFVLLVVVAPLAEEILFRGFLYRGLSESRIGVVGAIVVPALIWTLLHTGKDPAGMVDTMLIGLAWGWLRWRTGSTWLPIICHVACNGVVALTVLTKLCGGP